MSPYPNRRLGRAPSNTARREVRSLDRGLALLETLAGGGELPLTEIARRTRLPFSTTHRLLETLRRRRFVTQSEHTGLYRVDIRAFEVGAAFLAGSRLSDLARPVMAALVNNINETANLALRDDREAVYIHQVESRHMLRMFTHPGARTPLHCTGVGKALLAWLPDAQILSLLGPGPLRKFTERTVRDPRRLLVELRRVRASGYAIDREEREPGVRCVAAPIRDRDGRVVAALSVSAPAARLPRARVAEILPSVTAAAQAISRQLGWPAPFST
jgi:IclR family acetate operon transcriptional repressor